MATIFQIAQEISKIGTLMYKKGFVGGTSGNISVKLSEKEFLVTPSGVSKGALTPEMILLIDENGDSTHRELKPTSEIKLHLYIYKNRPDVNAIVHAHPIHATAFAVAGISLTKCVLPEIVMTIGGVPLTEYGTPSTSEVPSAIAPYLAKADVFLLANHGVVAIGPNLIDAYHKLENTEHFAEIVFKAYLLGNINLLSQKDVTNLLKISKNLGLKGKNYPCETTVS
jgi:L-fuculose-phosphate aldolase